MTNFEERIKAVSKIMLILMKVFSILIIVSLALTVVGLAGIAVSPENFSVQFEKLHLSINGMVPELFMGSAEKTTRLLIYFLVGNILSLCIMMTLHKFFKQLKKSNHIAKEVNVNALKTVAVVMIIRGIVLSCLNVISECFTGAFDIVNFNFMESIMGGVILALAFLIECLINDKRK